MSRARGPVETPEYGKMVARMIRSYGRRVADADEIDLAQMLQMRDELDAAIVKAVHGQRTKWGRSWGYIAEAAGITRQAAQQRWGKSVNALDAQLHGTGATRPGDVRDNGGQPDLSGTDQLRELLRLS